MTKAGQHASAITALIDLAGDIPKAAARLRIKPATLGTWLEDRDFAAAYKASLLATFENSLGRVQIASKEAVDTLLGLMRAKDDANKLRACRAVIELGRIAANRDVLGRLQRVEAALKTRQEAHK
jgi:hypothetical protein